ncbi:30S ribosomal protein S12 methylthiotransferase RimO [Lepagella muris]|uniref:30S ribosomal protein S12 methylthiotransferase RimO n=1 Tax=Lepagella muris TaxID=3032870 RepID=A0AC61RJK1_9BACT|nr:30S ribosomal protein S12 methylthiotransferase RimO [Lepagella muris]TGY80648.1 30S ribosomal protein S12 methylthiotransferase RimO [Lepagella muris]THG53545.1 30S ribosomal protein S12 methylthiotransferase RimO [Bacteroidales bacterium]TKC55654.1 30S ribosomal protein S12 methylthiotransferase RimO [Bacteroidales bacterium]
MFKKNRIDIISMGCSKNLIDSERLIRQLSAKGYEVCHDSDDVCGEYVVVNTCGFIADAKEESISVILDLARLKEEGKIKRIIVMGCLSQRYMDDLKAEIPEVDTWYGKFDWKEFINRLPDRKKEDNRPKEWERTLTTPPHSAYLKISEGCNRFCAFCAIPIITGRHTSRPIEEILEEVRSLVDEGVKEFNVIAQDLSSYGTDLYGRHALAELIERMALTPGVEWIRLHYAYPADFPTDILPVMAKYDNVCKYLDIALQHIANPVLDNMRRHIDKDATLRLIETIRREVLGIKLRTTLMTGFPGEGEKEFEELVDFVRTQRFDRMGAFAYCEEDDTYAAKNLDDSIPDDVKQSRLDKIMEIQEEIALQLNEEMIGTVQRVLIDRIEGDKAIGRTQFDSPEVDPEVIINDSSLSPGQFVNVRITEAFPFELVGETVR